MKVRCVHCGKYYPEEEYVCPHCKTVPDIFICPECGALVGAAETACAYCGNAMEGRPVCASTEEVEDEYRIVRRELRAAEIPVADLKALRGSLVLLGKYLDTDADLKQVNERLMRLEMQDLKTDLAQKAAALEADETAVPPAQLPEVVHELDAQGENPELVDRFREKAEQEQARTRRKVALTFGAIGAAALIAAGGIVAKVYILPAAHYAGGNSAFASGNYEKAQSEYLASGGWKDADEKAAEAALGVHYASGAAALADGEYDLAREEFTAADGFLDSAAQLRAVAYAEAASLQAGGDYAAAAAAFAKDADYEDSASRIFACGKALCEAGDYAAAQSVFATLSTAESANYALYCSGMAAVEAGDDSTAVASLKQVSGIAGAEQTLQQAEYRLAEACFAGEDYTQATELYRELGDYEDAADKAVTSLFRQAEAAYARGYLNTAKACYEALPAGYEADGVSVAARLSAIEGKAQYLNYCGVWGMSEAASYDVKKVNTTNGIYEERRKTATDLTCTVGCVILDNGRIHLEGTAEYYLFPGFDQATGDEELQTVTISQDIISLPYSFMADDNVKITVGTDSITLNYSRQGHDYDESYLYDLFETECRYDQRTEAY